MAPSVVCLAEAPGVRCAALPWHERWRRRLAIGFARAPAPWRASRSVPPQRNAPDAEYTAAW